MLIAGRTCANVTAQVLLRRATSLHEVERECVIAAGGAVLANCEPVVANESMTPLSTFSCARLEFEAT
jgi:hypothetical protein